MISIKSSKNHPSPATDALYRQTKRVKIEMYQIVMMNASSMLMINNKSFDLQELARASTLIADSLSFPLIGWFSSSSEEDNHDVVHQDHSNSRRSSLQHHHRHQPTIPDDVQPFLVKEKLPLHKTSVASSKRQLVRSIALHKQLSNLAHSNTRS